jgi:hypothetical protein
MARHQRWHHTICAGNAAFLTAKASIDALPLLARIMTKGVVCDK